MTLSGSSSVPRPAPYSPPRRNRAPSPARSRCGRRCCPSPGSSSALPRGSATTRARRRGRRCRRPLDRGREVADHGVEPDVDALVLVLGVAGDRDAHPPVEVARDRARPDVVEQREREVPDVRPPVVVGPDPGSQAVPNCGRSRKRWFVSRNSGVAPSMRERGSIRSVGRAGCRSCRTGRLAPRGSRRSGRFPRCTGPAACGRSGRERDEHLRSTIAPWS